MTNMGGYSGSAADPFKPMYCSLCSNRPMRQYLDRSGMVWECEHNYVRRPLSGAEYVELNAPRKTA